MTEFDMLPRDVQIRTLERGIRQAENAAAVAALMGDDAEMKRAKAYLDAKRPLLKSLKETV